MLHTKFLCFDVPHADYSDRRNIQRKMLKSVESKRIKEHDQLVKAHAKQDEKVRETLSTIDYFILQQAITKNVNDMVMKTVEHHENKLHELTENTSLPFASSEVITNLSENSLKTEEDELLRNGLDFGIPR